MPSSRLFYSNLERLIVLVVAWAPLSSIAANTIEVPGIQRTNPEAPGVPSNPSAKMMRSTHANATYAALCAEGVDLQPHIVTAFLSLPDCLRPQLLDPNHVSNSLSLYIYIYTYICIYPEGPSTQYSRTLVPKTVLGVVFGTRVLKYWVLGPSRYVYIYMYRKRESSQIWQFPKIR